MAQIGRVYTTSNSGLPNDSIWLMGVDEDGSHWFGTFGGGVAHYDDTTWTLIPPTRNYQLMLFMLLKLIQTDYTGSVPMAAGLAVFSR